MPRVLELILAVALVAQIAGFSLNDPFALGDVAAAVPAADDAAAQRDASADKSITNTKDSSEGPLGTGGALTAAEFEALRRAIAAVGDAECQQDLNATLLGILAGRRWALAMYDATAKSGAGIESGMIHQFGHYDECLGQNARDHADDRADADDHANEVKPDADHRQPVRAKYCLTQVTLDGLTVHGIASRKIQPTNYTIAHWGACVPASCGVGDVAILLESLLQRRVSVDDSMCQLRDAHTLHVTDAMFAYAVVIFFFVFLAVLSTSYHAYLLYTDGKGEGKPNACLRNETLDIALKSFSIIENTKKMFQASKDQLGLNSINGIKSLAMLFILAGHALSFIYGGPVYNGQFMDEHIKKPAFAFLPNSLLFVDTFLILSGFLFCRILLIELERRRGKLNVLILYAGRYIRLTPAYMAIIGFYMTWFPHVGDGPIWRQRIELEQDRCTASWWLNILYINNYINTDKLCMFQSWYLSVDSQLFFVAPVVIYLLYRSRRYGLRLLVTLVLLTASIPFIATYLKKLDPTLMVYADEVTDLATNAYYVGTYVKTHMRASAYAMGLLTGYLVHLMQEKGTKIPRAVLRLVWLVSIVVGVTSMFSIYRFYVKPYDNWESSLYAGSHKIGWNLSVAWLVIAATTGHAGWLQRMLSSRFFAPISRLTYCAYLSNGIIELYHSSSLRQPIYMGYIDLSNIVCGHILNTFTVAFVLCLLFESPIHALERILLRNDGRKRHQEQETSRTPSTSEEQVA